MRPTLEQPVSQAALSATQEQRMTLQHITPVIMSIDQLTLPIHMTPADYLGTGMGNAQPAAVMMMVWGIQNQRRIGEHRAGDVLNVM
jgi:hypothetical protein